MARSALLIANPAAGFATVDPRVALAARRLASEGIVCEIHRTTGPGDAEAAAQRGVGAFDLVIAAGGDGTIHEVANGLAGSATPLGIVPMGTMNILARELGMPLEAEAAAAWIARAAPAPVSLGRIERENGEAARYFVLMAGIGYDAFALESALARARRAGRKVGFVDYTLAATLGARRYGFPRFDAESDGWRGSAVFGFVFNCPRYGGNFRIAPDASMEDEILDLVLFDRSGFVHRLGYFAAMLAGRLDRASGVATRKVHRLALTSEASRVPLQLDGEPGSSLPAVIRCIPGALHLLRTRSRS